MSTLLIAAGFIGFIGLVVALLKFVHKREMRKDALKNNNTPV